MKGLYPFVLFSQSPISDKTDREISVAALPVVSVVPCMLVAK